MKKRPFKITADILVLASTPSEALEEVLESFKQRKEINGVLEIRPVTPDETKIPNCPMCKIKTGKVTFTIDGIEQEVDQCPQCKAIIY